MMAVFLVSAVPLCGCSAGSFWDKTVSTTQSLYSTYINPPAEIDYSALGDLEDYQITLAQKMQHVEIRLADLERYMVASDRPPTAESVAATQSRFPWLSGMAAVDADGEVLAQEPQYSLKQLDFSLLTQKYDGNVRNRSLVGQVQESPLGAEILLGVPIYKDTEFLGLYVVHFDIRSLIEGMPDPGGMVILSPETVVWPGKFAIDDTPLAGVKWKNVLSGNVSGMLSNKQGSFYWMARYLGGEPLVFAVPASGTFREDESQVASLSH